MTERAHIQGSCQVSRLLLHAGADIPPPDARKTRKSVKGVRHLPCFARVLPPNARVSYGDVLRHTHRDG